jgi:hypothetical protein
MDAIRPMACLGATVVYGPNWIHFDSDIDTSIIIYRRRLWIIFSFGIDGTPRCKVFGRNSTATRHSSFDRHPWIWIWIFGCRGCIFGPDTFAHSGHEIWGKLAPALPVHEERLKVPRRYAVKLARWRAQPIGYNRGRLA